MFVSVEGDKDFARLLKKEIWQTAARHGSFYSGAKPVKTWLQQRYESACLHDPLMDIGMMTNTVHRIIFNIIAA